MAYTQTLSFNDLTDGSMCGIHVEDKAVLLIRTGDTVQAYEDQCAHRATALSDGILSDGVLTCHAHFWQYDPVTGKSIEPPGSSLKRFDCKVEDGFIFVDVHEEDRQQNQPSQSL
jgi:nitrite reductase/ring-hydroxylating ferredoxin subunit